MEVSAEQLKKETNQPEDGAAGAAMAGSISREEKPLINAITQDNILGKNLNLEKRKQAISARGFEPTEFAYERAIGKNDSLYTNFTELIALTKRKVGRIVIKEDGKKTGYATGFMVSDRLLLTNWHVFRSPEMAEESEVHFFYEYDSQGYPSSPVIFRFDTSGFFNSEDLDYCFVAVRPVDVTGKVSLASIGYLFLDRTLGKIGEVHVERLNIIHHPQGDYKQISIRENIFVGIESTKIFYETDTAQGSSGSPVFNDQWQVVGLHHKSVAKMSADGENFLDKDDKIIPVIDDKIDVTRVVWLKNEGMRISVVLNHLNEKNPGDPLVAGLAVPPARENLRFMVIDDAAPTTVPVNGGAPAVLNDSEKNININVPVSALGAGNSIEISLSNKAVDGGGGPTVITLPGGNTDGLLFLEVAKVDKERAADFSMCKGYDPEFLGVKVALPQPKKVKAIQQQIARTKNREIELKYFKHSVIFNAVTKMPFISAVNVEGDPTKRLDNSKRQDDWLRDARIDVECQLTDKFYAASKFDKGHMSRFEDADWDDTEEAALRNGVYTCFYTNACPQVAGLNRAGGLWGRLEKAVLERGIKKETGVQARMSVFNGPIFNEDKDRIFRGVRIPMDYFKIILWLNDAGELRATGFKLSQETLVGEIKFDENMLIDEEALDIDKDVVFKSSQCSIKTLGKLTHIDFKHLEKYDTFKATDGGQEAFLEDIESIVL
jgi:endonuclease G